MNVEEEASRLFFAPFAVEDLYTLKVSDIKSRSLLGADWEGVVSMMYPEAQMAIACHTHE